MAKQANKAVRSYQIPQICLVSIMALTSRIHSVESYSRFCVPNHGILKHWILNHSTYSCYSQNHDFLQLYIRPKVLSNS